MKKVLVIAACIFWAWAANAQSAQQQSSMTDSSHRHNGYRNQWRHGGSDSLHQKNTAFSRDRGESRNRFAESGHRHGFREHKRFPVHFSPQQRELAQSIRAEYRKKSEDLFKQDNITLKEYKSRLLALKKEQKIKMDNLLTPEQKDRIAKWKKEAGENAQVRAAAHLERMKIRLNLTDQQATAIKAKQTDFRMQMKSIHENDNLLPYQKKEEMKALAANQKNAIKSVLTPEQLSNFESMHKQKFGER